MRKKNKQRIRGVLVDPYKSIVKDIEFTFSPDCYLSDTLGKICGHQSFDIIKLNNAEDLFVDEDGFQNCSWSTRLFEIGGGIGSSVVAHCGLILNHDANGEISHTLFDADYYRPFIRFMSFSSENVSVPEYLKIE